LKIPDSDVSPVGGEIYDEPKSVSVDVSESGSENAEEVEKSVS